LTQPEAKKM